ncbi:hypothetical protein ACFQ2B_16865 [Streptomyces stramineus]
MRGGAGEDVIEADTTAQPLIGALHGDADDDIIRGLNDTVLTLGPQSQVDGGAGLNTCKADNRLGGTVTNCQG